LEKELPYYHNDLLREMQRDHESGDDHVEVPSELDQSSDNMITGLGTKFSFPFKLHALIDDAARDGRDDIVSWIEDGKAFQIHKSEEFTDQLLPTYFDQIKYRSFQRQLHLYGFRLLRKSSDSPTVTLRGAYAHNLFRQGERELCHQMARRKVKSDFRKHDRMQLSPASSAAPEFGKDFFLDNNEDADENDDSPFNQISGALINHEKSQEVVQKKQRVDQMLGSLWIRRNAIATQKKPSTLKDDLQDGDASFFAGRKFYFVDYDMGEKRKRKAPSKHGSHHPWYA